MNPSTLIGIVASVALLSVVMLFAAREPALFVDLPSLGIVVVEVRRVGEDLERLEPVRGHVHQVLPVEPGVAKQIAGDAEGGHVSDSSRRRPLAGRDRHCRAA